MSTLMVILGAAAVGFGVATWRRIPPTPLLLFIGIALNLTGVLQPEPMLYGALVLGLTFLVFVVGAELDVARVGGHVSGALRVGLAQFVVLGTIGVGAARLLGYDWITALYVGLALTASSTLLIVSLLRQRQQLFEPFGRLVVGALLVQDVLVVLLLPILTHLADGPLAIAHQIGGILVMVGLTWVCIRYVAPLLLLRMGLDEESMLLTVLAILFAFMGLAYAMDIPPAIGAFLAGVSMAGFPVGGVVRGQLTSLSDFFLAVFFVTLGASVSMPDVGQLLLDAVLLTSVLLVTPPLVMLFARRAGMTTRSSIEAAHLLAQCGEFSLLVMVLGVQRGHVSENVLAAMMMLVVLTLSVTPLLSTDAVTWRLMRLIPGQRARPGDERPRNHVLLLGCGRHARTVLERLLQRGQPVVVVDDDAGVVQQLRDRGVPAFRGDGADYGVLRRAGARDARVIVSTMRRSQDNERLLRFVSGENVLIRIFSPEAGARVAALGGTPIVESEAAAEDFLEAYAKATGAHRAPSAP